MVKIRLRRTGAKNRPSYRIIATDSRAPRDGAFIATLGHYNPLTDPATIMIDEGKARKWIGQGAQPTERVAVLLSKLEIIEKPTKKHTERLAKKIAAAAEEKPARKAAKKPSKKTAEKPAKEPVAEAPEEPAAEPAAEEAEAAPEEGTEQEEAAQEKE